MLEVRSDGNVVAGLTRLMARLTDYSSLLPRLGTVAMDAQKKHIEDGRDINGETFEPLSEATVRQRGEGHPYGIRPLLDSTAMYQSIHFEERGTDSVFAGPSLIDAPYFPYVNQGAPKRGIPERTFVGLAEGDRMDLADAVESWTSEVVNA
jgi:hypothetical protein